MTYAERCDQMARELDATLAETRAIIIAACQVKNAFANLVLTFILCCLGRRKWRYHPPK
jgi:hypothetical protein